MVVVGPAEPRHVPAIAVVLEEMDRFYGAADIEPLSQRLEHKCVATCWSN